MGANEPTPGVSPGPAVPPKGEPRTVDCERPAAALFALAETFVAKLYPTSQDEKLAKLYRMCAQYWQRRGRARSVLRIHETEVADGWEVMLTDEDGITASGWGRTRRDGLIGAATTLAVGCILSERIGGA